MSRRITDEKRERIRMCIKEGLNNNQLMERFDLGHSVFVKLRGEVNKDERLRKERGTLQCGIAQDNK
jgi:hypothetical protein